MEFHDKLTLSIAEAARNVLEGKKQEEVKYPHDMYKGDDVKEAKTPSARAQFNAYAKAYGIKAHGMNNPKEAEKVLKFIFNAYKGKLTPEMMHDLVAKGFFKDGIKANLAGQSNDFESINFNGNKWIQQFDYAAYIKKQTGVVKESLDYEDLDEAKAPSARAQFNAYVKAYGIKAHGMNNPKEAEKVLKFIFNAYKGKLTPEAMHDLVAKGFFKDGIKANLAGQSNDFESITFNDNKWIQQFDYAAYIKKQTGVVKEEAIKEEAIEEAIGNNDILVMKEPARLDPTRLIPSFQYKPASILRALKKAANDNTKPALQGAYIDGESIVHKKTSKTIANFKLDGTFKQLLSDVEKWAEKNAELFAPKAPKPTIYRSTDTRVIITATDDQAIVIKKAIHNAKTKTMVRIMKRKDGSKVYIDTADNASLETAIKAAEKLLSQNEAVESLAEESDKQKKYQAFFQKALKKFGVKTPAELEGDKKKEFFDYVDAGYEADNEED